MSEQGFIVYKCRRCNKIMKEIHAPNVLTELIHITLKKLHHIPGCGFIVKETDIHHCGDGHIGITDIIGAELDNINDGGLAVE